MRGNVHRLPVFVADVAAVKPAAQRQAVGLVDHHRWPSGYRYGRVTSGLLTMENAARSPDETTSIDQ